MPILYVEGDATRPHGHDRRIVVHVCNDLGAWGAGFVLAVTRCWPEPEARYRAWHQGREEALFELGQVQFVLVEENLWVANLIGQHGIRRQGGAPPIRYEAVRQGLARVAAYALEHGASVHMPRIGAGLAGGKWDQISKIIEEKLVARGVAVTVYDLASP